MARTVFDVLIALSLVIFCPQAPAQDNVGGKSSPKKPANLALKSGDVAPPLTVSNWLQGKPIEKFEPGKVYVIEFWATWCAAPIRYMPYLAELHKRYKDQGVTVTSFTSRDIRGIPGNNEDKVTAFVKKRGANLGYTFAYANDNTTVEAWLKGQEHFCTFVVDKTGRIAFIGGPMFVGLVLPKVLGGADAKTVGDEMAKVLGDYQVVAAAVQRDAGAFLHALDEFQTRYPQSADFLPVVVNKLVILFKQGRRAEAKAYAEKLIATGKKERNVFVLECLYIILREKKEDKELLALALQAAQTRVAADGGTVPYSLLNLADAYLVSGDREHAKECVRRAIHAVADEPADVRQEIETEVRKLAIDK
jgi:thiol-disulfide isomerase/thioredoxin